MLRMKHLRLLREWTQRPVADLTDISNPHIRYIERGRMIPTPDQLKRLGYLGRSRDRLARAAKQRTAMRARHAMRLARAGLSTKQAKSS